ncbi:hypothetical protein FACS1894190_04150 [Spirochaetia bacterium]|nr:hypothetical protein FACS1894190_04150 [Spirochaetia bacterium]
MRIYNYSEARQNFATVLNTALKEEVIITRKDGSRFKLLSINKNELPRGKPRGISFFSKAVVDTFVRVNWYEWGKLLSQFFFVLKCYTPLYRK